jgi:hypothetical protein
MPGGQARAAGADGLQRIGVVVCSGHAVGQRRL